MQTKELTVESLQNAATRTEKLLQTIPQSQVTEFEEWE